MQRKTAFERAVGDRHSSGGPRFWGGGEASKHDFQELPAGGRGGSDGMSDTASLIFLVACTIVGIGIPAVLLEVYYFRIRKRRQKGR